MARYFKFCSIEDEQIITQLLGRSDVAFRIVPGLSGTTAIDNLIYAVETAIISNNPADEELLSGYSSLQRTYGQFFKSITSQPRGKQKPDFYQSINGR